MKKKHIDISEETHRRLLTVGKKGESFDQLVNRLLNMFYLRRTKMKRRNHSKGRYIVIEDFEPNDTVVIRHGKKKIIFEKHLKEAEIEIKVCKEGEFIEKKRGLILPFSLLEHGLENYEFESIYRLLKNPPKEGPSTVVDHILKHKLE